MTVTSISESKPAEEPAAQSAPGASAGETGPEPKRSRATAVLAVLLLIALGVIAYQYLGNRQLEARLAATEASLLSSTGEGQAVGQAVAGVKDAVAAVEQSLAEMQASVKALDEANSRAQAAAAEAQQSVAAAAPAATDERGFVPLGQRLVERIQGLTQSAPAD